MPNQQHFKDINHDRVIVQQGRIELKFPERTRRPLMGDKACSSDSFCRGHMDRAVLSLERAVYQDHESRVEPRKIALEAPQHVYTQV